MTARLLTQEQAIATFDVQPWQIMQLFDSSPAETGNIPGLGGGEWSAKDLL